MYAFWQLAGDNSASRASTGLSQPSGSRDLQVTASLPRRKVDVPNHSDSIDGDYAKPFVPRTYPAPHDGQRSKQHMPPPLDANPSPTGGVVRCLSDEHRVFSSEPSQQTQQQEHPTIAILLDPDDDPPSPRQREVIEILSSDDEDDQLQDDEERDASDFGDVDDNQKDTSLDFSEVDELQEVVCIQKAGYDRPRRLIGGWGLGLVSVTMRGAVHLVSRDSPRHVKKPSCEHFQLTVGLDRRQECLIQGKEAGVGKVVEDACLLSPDHAPVLVLGRGSEKNSLVMYPADKRRVSGATCIRYQSCLLDLTAWEALCPPPTACAEWKARCHCSVSTGGTFPCHGWIRPSYSFLEPP